MPTEMHEKQPKKSAQEADWYIQEIERMLHAASAHQVILTYRFLRALVRETD